MGDRNSTRARGVHRFVRKGSAVSVRQVTSAFAVAAGSACSMIDSTTSRTVSREPLLAGPVACQARRRLRSQRTHATAAATQSDAGKQSSESGPLLLRGRTAAD